MHTVPQKATFEVKHLQNLLANCWFLLQSINSRCKLEQIWISNAYAKTLCLCYITLRIPWDGLIRELNRSNSNSRTTGCTKKRKLSFLSQHRSYFLTYSFYMFSTELKIPFPYFCLVHAILPQLSFPEQNSRNIYGILSPKSFKGRLQSLLRMCVEFLLRSHLQWTLYTGCTKKNWTDFKSLSTSQMGSGYKVIGLCELVEYL
jgi:hypothetical protein